MPIPVAEGSKGESLLSIACWYSWFESRRWHGLSFVGVVCCHVEDSATSRSPLQTSATNCDIWECHYEKPQAEEDQTHMSCWDMKKEVLWSGVLAYGGYILENALNYK
jgi:hypothetical protein